MSGRTWDRSIAPDGTIPYRPSILDIRGAHAPLRLLSMMARRGRWLGPRSLRAPWWRTEPLARRVRALVWFRELLLGLWSSARDLQNYWRPVLTRDAGGWGSFWRLESRFNDRVRQGSSWRGLWVVCLRGAATLWEWDSFSWRVSQSRVFVYCPIGRPREVVTMRPLRAEGGRWPGGVVSTRSLCGFLDPAWCGPLIKPAVVSLIQKIDPGRILIDCWAGMLQMLGRLGMLH